MKCLVSFYFAVILNLLIIQASPTSKIIPEIHENKTINGEDLIEEVKIPEEIPEIAVEESQELKEVERAKKSATTTFCVEIRPEPSKAPVLICDNHQPASSASVPQEPNISHETHQQFPPQSPSNNVQDSDDSVVIIPSNDPEFFIPESYASDNYYPNFLHFSQYQQQPSQNVILPSISSNSYSAFSPLPYQNSIPLTSNPYSQLYYPPSPCSSTGQSGLYLQRTQPVFHSLIKPSTGNKAFSFDGMGLRSVDGNTFALNSRPIIPLGMEVPQDFGPEIVEVPFVKKHVQDLYRIPTTSFYPPNLYKHEYPYVVRNNLQSLANDPSAYILPAGQSRFPNGNFYLNNNRQSKTAVDGNMNMNMLQQTGPYVSSNRGYQTHSIMPSVVQQTPYQSYQQSLDPYPISRHSAFPGNTIYSQQSNIVQQPSISINSPSGILSPEKKNEHKNQEFEKKLNRKVENAETTNKKNILESVTTMSPSQILNEMRKKEFSGLNNHSKMQSFPRVNDNRLGNNDFAANILSDSKSFMIAGPKRSTNDKTLNTDKNGVEMEKNEVGKSNSS